jgi:hypothetical protein
LHIFLRFFRVPRLCVADDTKTKKTGLFGEKISVHPGSCSSLVLGASKIALQSSCPHMQCCRHAYRCATISLRCMCGCG